LSEELVTLKVIPQISMENAGSPNTILPEII
jgi:hypothetical protein